MTARKLTTIEKNFGFYFDWKFFRPNYGFAENFSVRKCKCHTILNKNVHIITERFQEIYIMELSF